MKNLLLTLVLLLSSPLYSQVDSSETFKESPTVILSDSTYIDSVWVTVVNVWDYEITKNQKELISDFVLKSDSSWFDKEDGWNTTYHTNAKFDTVAVFEIDPTGNIGYQFLYYTKK